MNERDHRLARHIPAKDQLIRAIKLPRIQELVPANIRTVNIRRKKDGCGHMQILQDEMSLQRWCGRDAPDYTLR